MITLRGKLTRTLVERQAPTPPTLRSTHVVASPPAVAAGALPPPGFAATAPQPPAAVASVASAVGAPAAAVNNVPSAVESAQAGVIPAPGAAGSVAAPSAAAATATSATLLDAASAPAKAELVEEWTWRGVWAFGDLPDEEEKKQDGEATADGDAKRDGENDAAGKVDAGENNIVSTAALGSEKESVANSTTETSGSLFSKLTSMITGGAGGVAKDATKDTPAADQHQQQPATGTGAASTTETSDQNPPPPTAEQKPAKKKAGRPPKNANTPARKKRDAEIAANAAKPRPFAYKWLKAVEAGGVMIPSSLVIVAAAVDEEERNRRTGPAITAGAGLAEGGSKDRDRPTSTDPAKESGAAVSDAATDSTGDAVIMVEADSSTSQQPQETTSGEAKDVDGNDLMKDSEGGPSKPNAPTPAITAGGDANATPPTIDLTKPPPEEPRTEDTKMKTQTFGEHPFSDANATHALGTCPKSGKWEGHFENVVPNANTGRKKKRDKRDNRVREMFYLFFNATPPSGAREAFVDSDSTIAANVMLDDKANTKFGGGSDKEEEEMEEDTRFLLPHGYIHVRGYGTNRFGTFEIVGSLDPASGTLRCQRMYVPVPTAADIARATGRGRRSNSGRFLSGLDLSIPGEEDDKRREKPSRKRKSTWKKRELDSSGGSISVAIGPDGQPVVGGGGVPGAPGGTVDIASIVKKRSRLSNESAGSARLTAVPGGVAGGGILKPPPQCRGPTDPSTSVTVLPPAGAMLAAGTNKPLPSPKTIIARSASAGSGKKGSKKKKAKAAPQSALSAYNKGPVVPGTTTSSVVGVKPKIPPAGDPFLARWRAAHYMYYQRVEQEHEGEGQVWCSSSDKLSSSGAAAAPVGKAVSGKVGGEESSNAKNTLVKINYVVYEGEMHDGIRSGRGMCLFNNGTLYEGQWKRNKEHGRGTLMTADRKRIIYEGAWEKGKMHGHGSYHYYTKGTSKKEPQENGRYIGQFRQSLRNGHGVYSLPQGDIYEGEFRENIPNGYGLFRWSDGSVYEGQWRDGKRHGTNCILVCSDGFRYEGSWVNNSMEGRGVATYPKGQVYDGTWVGGRREGRGTIRFTNGAVYEGRFKDDLMEGQGTMKMNRNVIIPKLTPDEKEQGKKPPEAASASNSDDKKEKHDWMIPLQFQSDISHIHQKAGFTQIGL